jgi:hypothetical protein
MKYNHAFYFPFTVDSNSPTIPSEVEILEAFRQESEELESSEFSFIHYDTMEN